MDYDNVGLLIGDPAAEVDKILTCLDMTPDVAHEAVRIGADLIVAHHPLIFPKITRINADTEQGRIIYTLIQHNVGLIAAHTNLDAARNGVSFVLADRIGLENIDFLEPAEPEGSDEDTGMGAIGTLAGDGLSQEAFLQRLGDALSLEAIRFSGTAERITKVAVCGGAGVFLAEKAIESGAQAFVTGDIKYHDYFTEAESFLLADVGHYESEVPIVETLRDRISEAFGALEVVATGVNTNAMKIFIPEHPQQSQHTE